MCLLNHQWWCSVRLHLPNFPLHLQLQTRRGVSQSSVDQEGQLQDQHLSLLFQLHTRELSSIHLRNNLKTCCSLFLTAKHSPPPPLHLSPSSPSHHPRPPSLHPTPPLTQAGCLSPRLTAILLLKPHTYTVRQSVRRTSSLWETSITKALLQTYTQLSDRNTHTHTAAPWKCQTCS